MSPHDKQRLRDTVVRLTVLRDHYASELDKHEARAREALQGLRGATNALDKATIERDEAERPGT
jgi:cysteinyl-tRNA synthetase